MKTVSRYFLYFLKALGCVVVIVGILAWLIMANMTNPVEGTPEMRCCKNLNYIGELCLRYSEENEGEFPPSLQALIPDYTDDFISADSPYLPMYFACPCVHLKLQSVENLDEWTTYVYM